MTTRDYLLVLAVVSVIAIVAIAAIVPLLSRVRSARAQGALRRWAVQHGSALHSASLSLKTRGPFRLDTRYVFRVVLTDAEGRVQRGWAAAGHLASRVDFVPDGPGEARDHPGEAGRP